MEDLKFKASLGSLVRDDQLRGEVYDVGGPQSQLPQ